MRALRWVAGLLMTALVPTFLPGATVPSLPESWIPARWQGGPLELERRARDKTLPSSPALQEVIARWYEPETLALLEGTPVNCLLVTWSAGADPAIEQQQHELVKVYTREAHARGIAVLGLVYPGSTPTAFVEAAADAALDGLVFEDGSPTVIEEVETALRARNPSAVVFPLNASRGAVRAARWPVLAVQGTWPRLRPLSELGLRAGPSSEPWIESNMWLGRSLRAGQERRPVWLDYRPIGGTGGDYARAVADSAMSGGRWIVTLDDAFRLDLRKKLPVVLDAWRRMSTYLSFYRAHAAWVDFIPFGALGVVVDASGDDLQGSDQYLKSFLGRKAPYRVLDRAGLTAAALEGLTVVVAASLAQPSEAEWKTLRAFAENGGLAMIGRAGNDEVTKGRDLTEIAAGKGRIMVYRDDLPDPEFLLKIMRDYMDTDWSMRVFNASSGLNYGSFDPSGQRFLLQLLNYSSYPAEAITVRVNGDYKTARFYTPEGGVADLVVEKLGSRVEIAISKLLVSGALLLEK